MVGVSVGKFAVMVVLLQLCAEVMPQARDSVTRKGIIKKMYTRAESIKFDSENYLDGVIYEKQGNVRNLLIKNGLYLVELQRYVLPTRRNVVFDFMVLASNAGYTYGEVVADAKLIKLEQDSDLEDAIILMTQPPGLEFVLFDGRCAFIETGRNTVSRVYDCSGDNFQAYRRSH